MRAFAPVESSSSLSSSSSSGSEAESESESEESEDDEERSGFWRRCVMLDCFVGCEVEERDVPPLRG